MDVEMYVNRIKMRVAKKKHNSSSTTNKTVHGNDGSSDYHENFANAIGFVRLPSTFRSLLVDFSFSLGLCISPASLSLPLFLFLSLLPLFLSSILSVALFPPTVLMWVHSRQKKTDFQCRWFQRARVSIVIKKEWTRFNSTDLHFIAIINVKSWLSLSLSYPSFA